MLGFACGVMQGLRIGDLTELYVRPKARRRGVARELVRAVVAALSARGTAFVTGGVAPDNAAARTFYEDAGFMTVDSFLTNSPPAGAQQKASGTQAEGGRAGSHAPSEAIECWAWRGHPFCSAPAASVRR